MLYLLGTDFYCSDVGTRPERVSIAYVGPGSRWEDGDQWIRIAVIDSPRRNPNPSCQAEKISDVDRVDFNQGQIFKKVSEILTRGYVIGKAKIGKIRREQNCLIMWTYKPTLTFARW